MSSEIYYDRAFIRVGDRFIPVVNHGSSNCFDFDAHGREVPEKHWSVLNYTFHGRQLFTEEEIRQIAAVYEAANSDNRDGIRKSRNRSFGVGEFGRWIMNGMKTAHTVEEWSATFVELYLEYDMSKDFLPQFEENSEKILNLMKMMPTSKDGVNHA